MVIIFAVLQVSPRAYIDQMAVWNLVVLLLGTATMVLAFMGAQSEFTPFSNAMDQLLVQNKWTALGVNQQFSYEDCGVVVEAYGMTNDIVRVEIRTEE